MMANYDDIHQTISSKIVSYFYLMLLDKHERLHILFRNLKALHIQVYFRIKCANNSEKIISVGDIIFLLN
jgi:hypothetical protein